MDIKTAREIAKQDPYGGIETMTTQEQVYADYHHARGFIRGHEAERERAKGLVEALEADLLHQHGKRNPFKHDCQWCSYCVARVRNMKEEALTAYSEGNDKESPGGV